MTQANIFLERIKEYFKPLTFIDVVTNSRVVTKENLDYCDFNYEYEACREYSELQYAEFEKRGIDIVGRTHEALTAECCRAMWNELHAAIKQCADISDGTCTDLENAAAVIAGPQVGCALMLESTPNFKFVAAPCSISGKPIPYFMGTIPYFIGTLNNGVTTAEVWVDTTREWNDCESVCFSAPVKPLLKVHAPEIKYTGTKHKCKITYSVKYWIQLTNVRAVTLEDLTQLYSM